MDGLVAHLFGWLAYEPVPWVIAFGLVCWAVASWANFKSQMRPPLESLVRARAQIKSIKDPGSFFEQYEEVNERLSKDAILASAWSEFSETLIIPTSPGARIRNTARPEVYFNQAILTKTGVNLRYFNALPNYLVGAGLLFTFLGLIAALYFAAKGIGGGVNEAIAALKSLLNAATFKFVTSITGLAASIVFSIKQKAVLSRFSHLLDDFCGQLEHKMDFVSPVALADQSQRELERQTSELQRFNTDLAVSIAQALDERIGETFTRALAPLAVKLEEMTKSIGSASEDALRSMIEDFSKTIQGAAGTEIKALAGNLNDVGKNLAGLIDGIKAANSGIQDEIAKGGEKLSDQIGEAGDQIAKRLGAAGDLFADRVGGTVNSFVNALEHFPERMQPIEDGLDKLTETIRTANNTLSNTLTDIVGVLSKIEHVTTNLDAAAEPLKETAKTLLVGTAELRATSDELKSSKIALEHLAQTLQAAGANLLETAKAQEGRFQNLDTALSDVFQELELGLEKYRDSVERFVNEVDMKTADVVQKLAASVDDLKEVLEDAVPRREPV